MWSVFVVWSRNAFVFCAVVVVFFVIAGRWDWPAGWGFIALAALMNGTYAALAHDTPAQPKSHSRPKLSVFPLLYLCVVFIGALDGGRFNWSTMPASMWLVGAALYVSAFVVLGWCSTINPYFRTVNRIRPEESGHRLITHGPYMLVRHPGYLATMTGYVFGTALMLHSWWAFVPGALGAVRLVFATAAEDKILLQMVDGYSAYAARVPYRLFPGIW